MQARSSFGAWIPRYQDETMAAIEERIANWTGVPVSYQEDMQVCVRAQLMLAISLLCLHLVSTCLTLCWCSAIIWPELLCFTSTLHSLPSLQHGL